MKNGYTGGELSVHTFERPERGWLYLAYDTGHFDNPREAEQAYNRDEEKRWHLHVQERADDWLDRIRILRGDISDWVAGGRNRDLVVEDRGTILMHEELMRRHDVPPMELPSFAVRGGNRQLALFRPKGLWIIGANGSLDVVTETEAPILVDRSEI